MSNQVTITPCEFHEVRTGKVSYGYCASDSYADAYCNNWDSIPDDDLELLALAMKDENKELDGMLSHVCEMGQLAGLAMGIWIGPVYYEWEQIKHLWNSDSLHDVAAEAEEQDRRDHKNNLYGPDEGEPR